MTAPPRLPRGARTDREASLTHPDEHRLRALEAALERAAPKPPAVEPGSVGTSLRQADVAWRMVIELVAGLVIGFVIGWGLDWLAGTRPVFLVLMTLAGLGAGVKTMLRTARSMGPQPLGQTALDEDGDD